MGDAQRSVRRLALDKLADFHADIGHGMEHTAVRWTMLVTEHFNYPAYFVPAANGKCGGSVQPDPGGSRTPGKPSIVRDVRHPHRFPAEPGSPGKINAGRKGGAAADGVEFFVLRPRLVPGRFAAENIHAGVHPPVERHIPLSQFGAG